MRSPIRCFSCSLGRGEIACRQVSEKHGRCSRALAMFGGRYETTIVSSVNHGTTTPSRGNLGLDGVHGSPIKWLDAASLLLFLACCRHAHGCLPYPCMRGSPSSMPFCRLHAQRNSCSTCSSCAMKKLRNLCDSSCLSPQFALLRTSYTNCSSSCIEHGTLPKPPPQNQCGAQITWQRLVRWHVVSSLPKLVALSLHQLNFPPPL